MMHQLLGRLAQFGGEGALGVLFVLSTVNFGIISQRVWFFVWYRINAKGFVQQLVPLLQGRDLLRAEALSQRVNASICSVVLAGLWRAEDGLPAVEQALETAISHERIHLEDRLVLLNELARLALLVGLLGSLFDVLALGNPNPTVPPPEPAANPFPLSAMIEAITPLVGGLLVAIPAWLARSMLKAHVQRVLHECEFVARLMASQLALAEPITPTSSVQPSKVRRVAA
jgi:biopolymer transport protein ExbB